MRSPEHGRGGLGRAVPLTGPGTWAGFSEALWAELARVFGWQEQPPVGHDEPPEDRQARADELAAAVRERFGIDLDVDYTPKS